MGRATARDAPRPNQDDPGGVALVVVPGVEAPALVIPIAPFSNSRAASAMPLG